MRVNRFGHASIWKWGSEAHGLVFCGKVCKALHPCSKLSKAKSVVTVGPAGRAPMLAAGTNAPAYFPRIHLSSTLGNILCSLLSGVQHGLSSLQESLILLLILNVLRESYPILPVFKSTMGLERLLSCLSLRSHWNYRPVLPFWVLFFTFAVLKNLFCRGRCVFLKLVFKYIWEPLLAPVFLLGELGC